jgi:hypothetical protein
MRALSESACTTQYGVLSRTNNELTYKLSVKLRRKLGFMPIISLGMVPVNRLLMASIVYKALIKPSSVAIVPVNLL